MLYSSVTSPDKKGMIGSRVEFWHLQCLSFTWGFPDDMYIQLESLTYGDGAIDSTIATQSESRLGKLDFGVNFDRSTLCSNTCRR